MIISIDHGNKQIKTKHNIFNSGLTKWDAKPAFGETIYYEGSYYVLSDKRIPHMWDKTINDDYFILTLFAIAKELITDQRLNLKDVQELTITGGLPPAHFSSQSDQFAQYFLNRGILHFDYNGKSFSILINNVGIYPQAFAATMHIYDEICSLSKVFIIDIGGFTVDYLVLKKGKAILEESDSLNYGIITLYNKIKSKVVGPFGLTLDESDIDLIIQDEINSYSIEVIQFIKEIVLEYLTNLFGELRERELDLRTGKAVFVGGGSSTLKNYIKTIVTYIEPKFIDDIKANLKGYEFLYLLESGLIEDEQ